MLAQLECHHDVGTTGVSSQCADECFASRYLYVFLRLQADNCDCYQSALGSRPMPKARARVFAHTYIQPGKEPAK
eukprot:872426-Alexandrium_andersonii.AAC.1